MTNYFSVKKNTNYILTVSKTGYYTHTEIINTASDITKNITLKAEFTPETTTFNYTGAVQTYTVPQGCTKLIVDCIGAAGKNTNYGKGGRVQCKLTVTTGQLLRLYVGGQNKWNGGSNYENMYGGDASDIRLNGTALNNRIIVAGGGGCGANTMGNGGAGGGLIGGDGTSMYAGHYGGYGGTQTAGGAGGNGAGGVSPGIAGSFGTGSYGGGGGWYGGGSSAFDGSYGLPTGGGGGGSSYTDPTLCTDVVHTQGYSAATGNGWIIITTSNE